MQSINEIMISEKINPNLTIRGGAKIFFDYIKNIPGDDILINFEGSEFISRSFAQEYLKQKRLINKNIKQVNVPENINSMFKIVENSPNPNIKKILEGL
ncbi:hypothetical protein [Methanobacterium spitsbergense]|uniref:DUF4325 domain-containing protein n=1 Tax=Methanobacterium spitsbergense TaxID=2874285 RepID=A0A8T5UTG2_9EURY|nr:hypothetical protein [Methanobacterium spitsbergense]MBZ2167038.1 hypothetical protein [Methanobacterium spitsbergense]